uniref:Uncharacterized protein n=1 Tax=Anguilla anguilla TaxID=7936 RepID=A0A0E9WMC5_ANGAN
MPKNTPILDLCSSPKIRYHIFCVKYSHLYFLLVRANFTRAVFFVLFLFLFNHHVSMFVCFANIYTCCL